MCKQVPQLVLVVILSLSCFGQRASHQNAGTPYFTQAGEELAANPSADVLPLIREGWAALKKAGVSDPEFANGVYSASRLLSILNRDLEVDAITQEALAACSSPALAPARAQISVRYAQDLLMRRDSVKAKRFMKENVAREEAAGTDPYTVLGMKMMLASAEDQQGDFKEAERILKAAMGQGKPDTRLLQRDGFVFMRSTVPYAGEPDQLLAALYSRHERTAEAVQIYRDRVASTQNNAQEHVAAMRQLAQVLTYHDSLEEAVRLQKQIVERETAQGQASNIGGDETTLATYEIRAGQKEEGMRLLQSEMEGAAARGNSAEYQWARSNLLQNAMQAGEFDQAEKMAREDLEHAQETTGAETGQLINAMSNLAQALRAKGDTHAADELNKQMTEMSMRNLRGRSGELQRAFAEVQNLNSEGKTADALARMEQIAADYYPLREDELWQFLPAAYSFLNGPQHKAEAVRAAELVMSLLEREGLATDPRSAQLFGQWANYYAGLPDDIALASRLFEKADTLIRECCGEQSPRMEMVLRGRVNLTKERGDRIAAIEKLRDFEAQVFGANSQDAENSTMMLAQDYMGVGDWGKAQQTFASALEMSNQRDGTRNSHHVNLMGQVAMNLLNYGKYQAALEMNEQALKLCEGVRYEDRIRPNLERVHRQIVEKMAQKAPQ